MSKIIIIDDEPDIRAVVKTILEKEGFEVSEASNADDGLKKIKEDKPDLILLDVMMPGMKSVDFVEQIKGNDNLKDIKIIYATAVGGAKETLKSEKGIVTVIKKPYDNDVLIAEIKKALG